MSEIVPEITTILERQREDTEQNLLMYFRQPVIQGFVQELRRWIDQEIYQEKISAFGLENTAHNQGKVDALNKFSLDLADFGAKAREKA